ncbi:hypothetical protein GE09DRAFT_20109 [Coniochaeta sp. 2T2.1]|nr:hypothetical protein GE09DRAFT_20109 [Coniochaeta sp. 2T2.1]
MATTLARDDTGLTTRSSWPRPSFFGRSLSRRNHPKTSTIGNQPKCSLGLTTLYIPETPATADLVFVHGLNGDAQNTWSRDGDSSFWPREWLPKDEAFREIRIHTFGYSSAIFTDGGVLDIPDFARSLLAAIQDAPYIPPDDAPPLVLVGHSMGGLVIKKAYILGHQIPEFQSLVSRIQAFFFLATPHQGADIALTLSRVLSVVNGKRQPSFVNDLFPQSPVVQSINDEFPRLCDSQESLQLFSFFETRPMSYGVGRGLIVDKHSAIMNYPRERRTHLDANHRDVARYRSPDDPSYITVRNALAAVLDVRRRPRSDALSNQERHEAIFRFLGSPEVPEEDVGMQDLTRLQTSGQWFLDKETFREWRDSASSKTLWLHGGPGTGKSYLAGNIVKHLREQGHDCSYFFFAAGTDNKGTINAFLRSMAYQMAMLHPVVHSMIRDLARRSETSIDKVDHNQLWRQLYLLTGITKVSSERQQYWVLDALDECNDIPDKMMKFLAKAQEAWHLCILVTSRRGYEPCAVVQTEVLSESILDELNTDISLLLHSNTYVLPASTGEGQERLADRIRQKSKGSFLWATLILRELRQVHTAVETELVLASYPSGMDDLYHKIVDEMAQARYGKDLAKAILVWTTCAFRPLSCEELQASIQLDIKEVINDAGKAAMSRCGNLILVDNRGRIQLIHTSARDFLLKDDLQSEFSIDIAEGHRRLALASIQCLADNAKVSRRSAKLPGTSKLVSYASDYLFDHLAHVEVADREVVKLLAKFLASCSILNWIEHIAAKSDLRKVYKAGTTIMQLLKRQPNSNSDIGHLQNDISRLGIWGSDLLHLSSRFSRQLRQQPSAIHRLIPPFCPLDSMIRKQFCVPNRGLGVHGASATWNDCFTVIALEKGLMPTSITVGHGSFALGFQTGKVMVYDDTILQELQTLDHQEAVRLLKFCETGKQIASASDKSIRIWNMATWTEVYRLPLKAPPLVLFFLEEDSLLLVATKQNEIMLFDLSSGELNQEPVNWTAEFEEPEWRELRQRAPAFAAFSPHHHLLAITYRGDDILVWDTAQDRVQGFYSTLPRSDANLPRNIALRTVSVTSLTFCSAPDTCLLAATYHDGSFVVYNVLTEKVQLQIEGANIFALASSPDGSTLAVRTRGSVIWLDSGNLRCLHREPVADDLIASKLLSVTADGQGIIELLSMQCRIWHRPGFAGQGAKDVGDCKDLLAIEQLNNRHFGVPGITALCCVNPPGSTPSIIIAGKRDGTVHVYEISGEPSGTELFTHGAVTNPIDDLHFDSLTGLLTCEDRYGRITCRKLTRFGRSEWAVGEILADMPDTDLLGHHQVLGSGTHSRVLSSCRRYASLWPFGYCKGDPHLARIAHQSPEVHKASRWFSTPINSDCLILCNESGVQLRSWTDLSCINMILFPHLDPVFSSVNHIISIANTRYVVTAHIDPSQSLSISRQYRFHIWDLTHLSLSQETFQPTLSLNALSASMQKIIGIHNDCLIYLDLGNWVCSIAVTEPNDDPVRHFFIPNDWLTTSSELVLDIAKNGEIVFVRQLELAVIKRGLDLTATGKPVKSSESLATLPIRSELTG